jgi:cytochrome c-type biogenesis protein CcsB
MRIYDWETGLFLLTIACYLISTLLYLFSPAEKAANFGKKGAVGVFSSQPASLILRTVQTWQLERRLPLTSQFELASIAVFLVVLYYLIIGRQKTYEKLGAFVMPIAAAGVVYAAFLPREIREISQTLVTYRRVVHVSAASFAYAAFLLAAAVGMMYLYQERRQRDLAQLNALDSFSYKVVLTGFLCMTVLLVTGVLWAKVAWGRYWGWDPKEVWALLTWFLYGTLLFGRRYSDWKGHLNAILVIAGFASMMMTFVGVRFLNSIHSY